MRYPHANNNRVRRRRILSPTPPAVPPEDSAALQNPRSMTDVRLVSPGVPSPGVVRRFFTRFSFRTVDYDPYTYVCLYVRDRRSRSLTYRDYPDKTPTPFRFVNRAAIGVLISAGIRLALLAHLVVCDSYSSR